MAILKQRLGKRQDDGTYLPVHLETSSDLVLRPDGTTVETVIAELSAKNAEIDSAIAAIKDSMPKHVIVIAASDTPEYAGSVFPDAANSSTYTCDGTNDAAVIKDAIKELQSYGGGTIYLLPGTYTGNISIGNSVSGAGSPTVSTCRELGNISIIGFGNMHRRRVETPQYSSVYMDGDITIVNGTITLYNTADNVRISGIVSNKISVQSNNISIDHCTMKGINAQEGHQVIIDNCIIDGNVDIGAYGAIMRNCHIKSGSTHRFGTDRNSGYPYTYDNVTSTCTTVDIIGNIFESGHVQIGGSLCKRALVANNDLRIGTRGLLVEVGYDASDNVNIDGRAVIAANSINVKADLETISGRFGIRVRTQVKDITGDESNMNLPVYIIGNKVSILPSDNVKDVTGIEHSYYGGIFVVKDNTVAVMGDRAAVNATGIYFSGNTPCDGHIIISNNMIVKCKLGLELRGIGCGMFSNNIMLECLNGIELSNTTHSMITNNIIHRSDSYASGENSIVSRYGTISGNIISDNITTGKEVSISNSGNTVTNNIA